MYSNLIPFGCPICAKFAVAGVDYDIDGPVVNLDTVLRTCSCDVEPERIEEEVREMEMFVRVQLRGDEVGERRFFEMTLAHIPGNQTR